jgi:hypothetical protein
MGSASWMRTAPRSLCGTLEVTDTYVVPSDCAQGWGLDLLEVVAGVYSTTEGIMDLHD